MIQLSASFLGTFKECMRCAWLEKNKKVRRPRGRYPSLPSGMDAAFKACYDGVRGQAACLPEELQHENLNGYLLLSDVSKITAWRQWNAKAALKVENPNWKLVGGFDEVLYNPASNLYIPADFKTASSVDRTEDQAIEYHQTQLDIYDLMLLRNDFQTPGIGVIYLWAPEFLLQGKLVQFKVKTFFIETDPKRALDLCDRAAKCLVSPIMPPSGDGCEYCKYASAVHLEMPVAAAVVA